MSDKSSPPRSGSNKPVMIAALVVVLAAVAVAAWFFLFSGDEAPEGVQVTEGESLVAGEAPSDLAAYLEKNWAPNLPEGTTYRVEGNRVLDLAGEEDGTTFKVAEIEFLALDTENEPPHFVDVRAKGIDIVLPAGSGPLGADRLQGEVTYAYQYDAAEKRLQVPAVVVDFPQVATLNFSGIFTDMTLSAGAGPEAALSGVGSSKVEKLSLVFTDRSIVKWALEQQAASQGIDADALRTQGKLMLAAMGSQLEGDIEKQAVEAAGVVLEKTENVTLEITANPSEPFPFANFLALGMGAGGMPDLSALEPLNLTIKAY